MPAPALFPRVDDNGSNQPADPAGIPEAIKTDGFQEKENVPNTWWNWLFKLIHDWIVWSESLFGVQHNIATGVHTVVTATSVTATGDLRTTAGDVLVDAGDVSALAGTVIGSGVEATGAMGTRRGIAGGDAAIVGGFLQNVAESLGVGAGSVAEEEAQFYDLPANTLKNGTVIRIRSLGEMGVVGVPGIVTYRVRIGAVAALIGARVLLLEYTVAVPTVGDYHDLEVEFRVRTPGAILEIVGVAKVQGNENGVMVSDVQKTYDAGEDGTAILRVSVSVQTAQGGQDVDFHYFTVESTG